MKENFEEYYYIYALAFYSVANLDNKNNNFNIYD